MLKGRQTGAMHRGHAWVFRAESHDTMLAWYEDIKNLTEKTGEARNAFVRKHVRSLSGVSRAASISSDGVLDEDEADETPYSGGQLLPPRGASIDEPRWRTPPGGRFPSEIHLNRTSEVPESPTSETSSRDRDGVLGDSSYQEPGIHFTGQQHPQHQSHMHETESPGATLINARSSSVRSTLSRKPRRIYDEWMTGTHRSAAPPQTPTYDHNANNHIYTPSPQVSRSGTRIRSIASSTGAPIVVPGDDTDGPANNAQPRTREPEASLLSTQPTGTDARTIPSLTTAATSFGALGDEFSADRESNNNTPMPNGATRGSSNANANAGFGPPITGFYYNEANANANANANAAFDNDGSVKQQQQQRPTMPSIGARTTTVSDLRVPGQYPANRT